MAEAGRDTTGPQGVEPGIGVLFRFSLLICGASLVLALLAFWGYRAYAWLFPG
jgi:hypothetical protein